MWVEANCLARYDFSMTRHKKAVVRPLDRLGPFYRPRQLMVPEEVRFFRGNSGIASGILFDFRCEDARIRWIWGTRHLRRPRPDLFQRFLRLGELPSSDLRVSVLKFASAWGPLGLCADNLPSGHEGRSLFVPYCAGKRCVAKDAETLWEPSEQSWEPIEAWRLLARQGRALVAIAARLREDTVARREDWEQLAGSWLWSDPAGANIRAHLKAGPGDSPAHIEKERYIVEQAVQSWLDHGDVRPEVTWHSRRFSHPTDSGRAVVVGSSPHIGLGSYLLFGHLAGQLLWAVIGSDALTICSACGRGYTPSRRPREGQRRFCLKCQRRKMPVRLASRAYRRRKRGNAD